MGVRGLTTFIAKRSDSYLRHHKLHDTYLVIDGNSLAANLYQINRTRNDCFGGDYDKFEKSICKFFDLLLQCNITPLIVLDGSYEKKKIRTVIQRLKNKLKTLQHVDNVSQSQVRVFPLFLRDLFVDVVLKLHLQIIRCDFEADFEIACLARTLQCPVLSYDSDFFVYDVLYIPFVTLEMSAYQLQDQSGYYLRCQLYEMDYFLKAYGGLNKSCIPLLAVLLGNDYINKRDFKDFHSALKLVKRKTQQNAEQRNISSVIKWLQKETYQSAIAKVLNKIPEPKRRTVAFQIKLVVEGYLCKKSKLLKDFGIQSQHQDVEEFQIDTENILQQSRHVEVEPCEGSDDGEGMDVEELHIDDDEDNKSDSDSELEEFKDSEYKNDFIPDWFRKNFRHCQYPTAFMDIIISNTYFCMPQLENGTNICSHMICAKIIAGINKILRPNTNIPLRCVARHQSTNLKWYETPYCKLRLPSLWQLREVNVTSAKLIIYSILEFDSSNFITNIPEQWQLYCLAIIYWIKNATPSTTHSHVQSIILCMIMLSVVGPKIGMYKSASNFLSKHQSKLDINEVTEETSSKETGLLKEVTKDDCLRCQKELTKYFEMETKMRTSNKFYNKNIVDCFAQFQTSLLHIKYLNLLLNKPFDDCIISEFYNGTFLYNMCTNLQKRSNVDAYMDTLLRVCPSILKCFKEIVNKLIQLLSSNITQVETKRKRRKRKRSTKISESSDDGVKEVEDSKNEGDAIIDKNNRFSLLNFV